MNETLCAAMRVHNLSAIGHWLVFTFGRTVEDSTFNGARYRTVEWRGERYLKVEPA